MKKILALVLALLVAMSMTAAFAAEGDLTGDGVVGDFSSANKDKETFTDGTTVKLYQEITAYNPETNNVVVNAPEISYTYRISAGTAGKDIYDTKDVHESGTSAHVKTKAGIGNPTITGFTLDTTKTLNASKNGTKNVFPVTVDFSGINFIPTNVETGHEAEYGPGVYRYVIEETTANKNASGIKEGESANTRYLDVYVNGEGKIYGFVCFTNDNSINASDSATSTDNVAAAKKTEGFTGEDTTDTTTNQYTSEDASKADKYYTFNLEITKDVVNDSFIESSHHQFPFTVTLDNPTVTAKVLPIMTVSTNARQDALTAAAIGTGDGKTTWSPKIADAATVTYVGIPCGTTVTITEKNDVTGTTYKSESTGADTNATSKTIFTGDDSNTATIDTSTNTALKAAAKNFTGTENQVKFTNKLEEISPTGVVMRVAPYIAMMIAGVALLIVARKRRSSKNED